MDGGRQTTDVAGLILLSSNSDLVFIINRMSLSTSCFGTGCCMGLDLILDQTVRDSFGRGI
jgi:hypothetical protein